MECGGSPEGGAGRCPKRRGPGQRGGELQQTVLMGSASSALELPATSCSSSALTSSCSTASTMGITMAVVDVLESHMESSVVQHMKQSSSLQGRAGAASTARPPTGRGPRSPRRAPLGPLQTRWSRPREGAGEGVYPEGQGCMARIRLCTPRAWHRVNVKFVFVE